MHLDKLFSSLTFLFLWHRLNFSIYGFAVELFRLLFLVPYLSEVFLCLNKFLEQMLSEGSGAVSISKRIFSFFDYSSLNESYGLDYVDPEFNFDLG